MEKEEYINLRNALIELADSIMKSKQPEYTNNHWDVLHNFKSTAKRLNISPQKAWGVFLDKHIQSILSHATNHDLNQAEPISTRYADAINYLILGYALHIDRIASEHEDLNLIYKGIE